MTTENKLDKPIELPVLRPKTWDEIAKRVEALGFNYPSVGENIGTLVIDLLLAIEQDRARPVPGEDEMQRHIDALLIAHRRHIEGDVTEEELGYAQQTLEDAIQQNERHPRRIRCNMCRLQFTIYVQQLKGMWNYFTRKVLLQDMRERAATENSNRTSIRLSACFARNK